MTQELRFIGKGDLIFRFGRFEAADWHFLGLGRFGVSYYVATGNEDEVQYTRLARLVGGK